MKENHREILVVSNEKGKKFSLIETDNNYIVACGYSALERWGQQWEHGIYYMFSNDKEKLVALNKATEKLFEKVNKNYIPRTRLEELATFFKDGLESLEEFTQKYEGMDMSDLDNIKELNIV